MERIYKNSWETDEEFKRREQEYFKEVKRKKRKVKGAIITAICLILAFVAVTSCIEKVPAGYVAVQYNMNGGVRDEVLTQGWHLHSPMVKTTIYTVGLEQSYLTKGEKGDSKKDERFTASSKEGKSLGIDLTFTYQFDTQRVSEVFTKFKGKDGESVRDTFIKPNVISWTKEVLSRHEVSDILGEKKAEINAEITEYLAKKLEPYGILISNASLINVKVDEATQLAIDNKIKAQQNAETQRIENKKNVEKAEADAKAQIIAAEAEAKAKLIEAKAEAKANEMLKKSLSNEVLRQEYLDKWNGTLPQYMGGGNDSVIFDMPSSN